MNNVIKIFVFNTHYSSLNRVYFKKNTQQLFIVCILLLILSISSFAAASDQIEWDSNYYKYRSIFYGSSTGELNRIPVANIEDRKTLKIGVFTDYFQQSKFLDDHDDITKLSGIFNLSYVPNNYLKLLLSVSTSSVSFEYTGDSKSLFFQTMGDSSLSLHFAYPVFKYLYIGFQSGAEFFTRIEDPLFDFKSTSYYMRLLSTTSLKGLWRRIPLFFHTSCGFYFENRSGIIPTDVDRQTYYAYTIHDYNRLQFSVAAEYINKYLNPFIEYSLEVPHGVVEEVLSYSNAIHKLGIGAKFYIKKIIELKTALEFGKTPDNIKGIPQLPTTMLTMGISYQFREKPLMEAEDFLASKMIVKKMKRRSRKKRPKPEKKEKIVKPVEKVEPKPVKVVVEPEKTYTVQGVIRLKDKKQPLKNVLIHIFDNKGIKSCYSDDKGIFKISGINKGEKKLRIIHDDYEMFNKLINLTEKTLTGFQIELEPKIKYSMLTGKVFDINKNGLYAKLKVNGFENTVFDSVTDKEGRFSLKVKPGIYNMQVSLNGHIDKEAEVSVLPGKDLYTEMLIITPDALKGVDAKNSIKKEPEHVLSKSDIYNIAVDKNGKIILPKEIIYKAWFIAPEETSQIIVDMLVSLFTHNENISKIKIVGHTDSSGNEEENSELSLKRANWIKDYMIQKGIKDNILETYGLGSSEPIDTNKTRKGRKQNRRIEFYLE